MKKSDVMACLGCMFFVFTFFGWLSSFDYRPGLHSLWIITYKGRLVTTLMLSKREYEDVINNMVQFLHVSYYFLVSFVLISLSYIHVHHLHQSKGKWNLNQGYHWTTAYTLAVIFSKVLKKIFRSKKVARTLNSHQ